MGDIALLLFCLLTGGYVLWETGTYPPSAHVSMDAGLYPRFLVYTLLFLAAILAVNIFRKRSAGGRFTFGNLPGRATVLMVCCMAAYCLLLSLVGYALATIAFVFASTLLFRGTVKDGILVSLSMTVFLEALFRGGFQVPLPPGMLNLF